MLYLKRDVLLSVDVFERLRDKCLEYYEIDPCYIFYSWINLVMWIEIY